MIVFAMNVKTVSAEAGSIVNGELDQWVDGKPVGWETGEGVVAAEDVGMRISGTAAIRMQPERTQPGIDNYVSISQEIQLKPNASYDLKFWAAKDGHGDVRAFISPNDGTGPVLEYYSGWADFFVWTEVSTTFKTTSATGYTLRLIQYGTVASDAWFDSITLTPVADPAARDTKARRLGVELYSQSYMVPFDNTQLDSTATATNRFVASAVRNEYAPVLVIARALSDLKHVDLRLVDDLKSKDGGSLKAEKISIRAYDRGVLPLSRPRDVSIDKHVAWWLTVQPDANVPAGIYTGAFEIVADGKAIDRGELVVDLLDLKLPVPDASFFLWHFDGYFRPEHLTDELQKAYYKDMVEHGMTTVTIYGTPETDDGKIDFSKNMGYQKSGGSDQLNWGYDKAVPAILETGMSPKGQPIILLITREEHGGRTGYDFGAAPESITRQILEEWFSRKWPTPLLYVHDEPSTPERIAAVRPILERIKSWNLPVRTVTAGLDIAELGHLYDMWIQIQFDINSETIMAAREQGAELWTYDCRVPYTNAPFNRALYGFWAYRAGLKGVGRWAYHDTTNTYFDNDGVMHGGVGPRLSHIVPSADGPVPTAAWEAAREGVNDYRLMMLYDETLASAQARLEELRSQYKELLSEEDIEQLTERKKQQRTRFREGESPVEWQAGSTEKALGEKYFAAADELEHALAMAKLARKKVIDSIPVDSMAITGAMPFLGLLDTTYPTLGLGDQRTVAETKRRVLCGYLQRVMNAVNVIPAG